ncbi:MAG TPA: DUF3311 domain-containing protein [Terriglobales bacterium]|jgi:hypothetical protein|nr:DUF3311 domain-containing protein [Terriglobales bacterium]
MKRPSAGALFFGFIPFIAICFSVSLWDRIHPVVLGVPFNFFWLILWMFLTPICLWAAYRMEVRSGTIPGQKKGTD